jgi:hypothetical protein
MPSTTTMAAAAAVKAAPALEAASAPMKAAVKASEAR